MDSSHERSIMREREKLLHTKEGRGWGDGTGKTAERIKVNETTKGEV